MLWNFPGEEKWKISRERERQHLIQFNPIIKVPTGALPLLVDKSISHDANFNPSVRRRNQHRCKIVNCNIYSCGILILLGNDILRKLLKPKAKQNDKELSELPDLVCVYTDAVILLETVVYNNHLVTHREEYLNFRPLAIDLSGNISQLKWQANDIGKERSCSFKDSRKFKLAVDEKSCRSRRCWCQCLLWLLTLIKKSKNETIKSNTYVLFCILRRASSCTRLRPQ